MLIKWDRNETGTVIILSGTHVSMINGEFILWKIKKLWTERLWMGLKRTWKKTLWWLTRDKLAKHWLGKSKEIIAGFVESSVGCAQVKVWSEGSLNCNSKCSKCTQCPGKLGGAEVGTLQHGGYTDHSQWWRKTRVKGEKWYYLVLIYLLQQPSSTFYLQKIQPMQHYDTYY